MARPVAVALAQERLGGQYPNGDIVLRRLVIYPAAGQKTSHRMTSAVRELPLSYPVPSEDGRCVSASTVHEPRPARPVDGAPPIASAGPFVSATPYRRPLQSSAPRVRLHLKPGQKGTKQLLAQCGDRLVCVRYRYDAMRKKRYKTVELLIAERDWEPPRPRFAHDQLIALRVAFAEVALRDHLKQAGATWNPARKVWQLRYDRVATLGLTSRIAAAELASTGRCPQSGGEHLRADTRPPSR